MPWWVKFLKACSRQCRNNLHIDSTYLQTYTFTFTFTFMHLADAFIQSDLQLHSGYTFSLVRVFPGNRTHNLLCCWRNALPLSHTGTHTYTEDNASGAVSMQAVMQPVRMLSTVQEQKDLRILGLYPMNNEARICCPFWLVDWHIRDVSVIEAPPQSPRS